MVDKLKKIGATVVFCQKGIDDLVQHYLAKQGIYGARRLKESDIEKIAKATGAKHRRQHQRDLRKPLTWATRHGRGEEDRRDDMALHHRLQEPQGHQPHDPRRHRARHRGSRPGHARRLARGRQSPSRTAKAVPGGGAPGDRAVPQTSPRYASTVGGREQLAIEAFAQAMEVIPWALAENAGLDAMDVVIKLKSAHEGKKANKNMGWTWTHGKPIDMLKENVIEPLRVKTQAVKSAAEVANMILQDRRRHRIQEGPSTPPGGGGRAACPQEWAACLA